MGRKKKVVETQQEQTNVEIRNNPKYSGSVNIRVVKNGRTIQNITKHNEGNTPLFSFLIGCLSGTLNEKGIPNYINLGYMDGSDYVSLTTYKLKSSSNFPSNVSVSDVVYPSINYQFTIPTLILDTKGEGQTIIVDAMRLYSADNVVDMNNSNWSAQIINIDPKIKIKKDEVQKYTLFITWSLAITNQKEI